MGKVGNKVIGSGKGGLGRTKSGMSRKGVWYGFATKAYNEISTQGGRAKVLESILGYNRGHNHARGHRQVVPNFYLASSQFDYSCEVFRLYFGYGLYLGYFGGFLWITREVLWITREILWRS